jgi:acyl carrier protein
VSCLDEVKEVLGKVLHLGKRTAKLSAETRLFGSLPELDSMAVVLVVVEIEERFGIKFDEEKVTAETFETVGSLASAVDRMRSS